MILMIEIWNGNNDMAYYLVYHFTSYLAHPYATHLWMEIRTDYLLANWTKTKNEKDMWDIFDSGFWRILQNRDQ